MGIRSGCLSLFPPALSGRIPADTSDFWGRRRGVPMRGIRLSTSGGGAAGGVVSGAAGRAPRVLCGGRYSPGDGAISVGGAGGFVLSRGACQDGVSRDVYFGCSPENFARVGPGGLADGSLSRIASWGMCDRRHAGGALPGYRRRKRGLVGRSLIRVFFF